MFDHTTLLIADKCPACGYKLDAATGLDSQPDDLTVCPNCAFILVFDERLKVRKATKEDLAQLDTDTLARLGQVLGAIHRYKSRNN